MYSYTPGTLVHHLTLQFTLMLTHIKVTKIWSGFSGALILKNVGICGIGTCHFILNTQQTFILIKLKWFFKVLKNKKKKKLTTHNYRDILYSDCIHNALLRTYGEFYWYSQNFVDGFYSGKCNKTICWKSCLKNSALKLTCQKQEHTIYYLKKLIDFEISKLNLFFYKLYFLKMVLL